MRILGYNMLRAPEITTISHTSRNYDAGQRGILEGNASLILIYQDHDVFSEGTLFVRAEFYNNPRRIRVS